MEMNTELIAKAKKAKTPEELMDLAKENGIEMTEEIATTYFEQLNPKTGELSDDELDNVAGGGCYADDGALLTTIGYKCKYYEENTVQPFGVKGTCCRCKYWGVDPTAISASLWTTVVEVIITAAKAAEPRECFHPANRKKR